MSWLSSLFGGSDSDEKMIKMQEEAAEEAKQKEAERQARLDAGLAQLTELFEGSPVMQAYEYLVPGSTATGAATTRQEQYKDPHTGANRTRTVSVPGQTTTTPDKTETGYYDTGEKTGGFDDDFYNTFKQSILDYYMPQVSEQYGEANDELKYRLARAGTLNSSMANTEYADLFKQNEIQEGKVRSQADTATADLTKRVADEKQNAINQLYATEDPEIATNVATAAIRNISPTATDLSPLADVFQLASVGGAKFGQGAYNQYLKATQPATASNTGTSRYIA